MASKRPSALSANVTKQMKALRTSGTGPELCIRKALHRMGLRFRVQYAVPEFGRRTVDIAFPRRRIAVFVDGCFWHGCMIHKNVPANNHSWWSKKLAENKARDLDTNRRLTALGWQVIRVWEHEPVETVADYVAQIVQTTDLTIERATCTKHNEP